MLHTIFVVLQLFVCVSLIILVLIQHGKGADMGAAFGSGASSTMFGSQGSASFLTRITAGLAAGFFILSLILAYFSTGQVEQRSVVESLPVQTQPAATPETTIEVPVTPESSSTSNSAELPPVQTVPVEVPVVPSESSESTAATPPTTENAQ